MITGRNGILPDQFFRWDFGSEVAALGPHVAVGELKPGTGKSIGILVRIFQKTTGDFFVSWIKPEGKIGGKHGWLTHLGRIKSIGNTFGCILRHPLLRTGWTGGQFPLEVKQILQVIDSPLRRSGGPGNFRTCCDRIRSATGSISTGPSKPLFLNGCSFWLRANMGNIPCTVGFTKGMSTSDEGHGFFIIHRHPAKSFTDIMSRSHWIRIPIGSFRVYIDQSHLYCSQWVFKVTLAGVPLVVQPGSFGSPVDIVLGFPDIWTTTTKAKSFKAHGL